MFFRLAAGGPAIGVAGGMAMSLLLYRVPKKHVVELLLTVAAAYGAYLLSDQVAGSSGILSVVFLGKWQPGIPSSCRQHQSCFRETAGDAGVTELSAYRGGIHLARMLTAHSTQQQLTRHISRTPSCGACMQLGVQG